MSEVTETEGTEGAAGASSSSEASGSSQTAVNDYLARARQNPEWAVEQIRSHQSRADKNAEAEKKYQELVRRLGPAQALIDTYGGDVVATATNNYAALRQAEGLAESILEFEKTGQLPQRRNGSAQTMEQEEEYLTPEEHQIRELRQEVENLKSGLTGQAFTTGKATLERHMQEVLSEFQFAPEKEQQLRENVVATFERWRGAGEPGKQALNGILGPGGAQTIRGIMLGNLSAKDIAEAAQGAALRKQQKLGRLATDGPGGIASSGRETRNLSEFDDLMDLARSVRADPDAFDSR